jgi:mevalonate kinase
MNYLIPAKTFLLGEYSATAKQSAIVMTTKPCFEYALNKTNAPISFHPESPAGTYLSRLGTPITNMSFIDPYHGLGGLGASSAEFVGVYLAQCKRYNKALDIHELLHAYQECAYSGIGLKPSGYDVIAQTLSGCVYINLQNNLIQCFDWVFSDLTFFLVHTGKKLPTHQHLAKMTIPLNTNALSETVDRAKEAFIHKDSNELLLCINNYQEQLETLNLVAPHTQDLINQLKLNEEVLAIKGCGALGADTILVFTTLDKADELEKKLTSLKLQILSTPASIL